ncbi:hypothetical protein COU74_00365 [Candidatus Peregrinibacteria bacterium CG10_big_fil_rev_8_21_14_0_10_36_19]|nr:MAG: hypothetical protein COU74_00365 [Candidatus Peregrinibacteria bacterium CG10_big_fil_rev_8_21_14_0_10_36_19]
MRGLDNPIDGLPQDILSSNHPEGVKPQAVALHLVDDDLEGIKSPNPKSVIRYSKSLIFAQLQRDRSIIKALPILHKDPHEDQTFKRGILEKLSSTLDMIRPASEQLRGISQSALEYNIKPSSLSKALGTEEILGLLIDQVIDYKDSKPKKHRQPTNINAPEKKNVDGEVATKCEEFLNFFIQNYDPKSSERSLFKFIRALEKKYSEYDIKAWLKVNKAQLIKLIGGENNANIKKIVNDSFLDFAKSQGREDDYIRLICEDLPTLNIDDEQEMYKFINSLKDIFSQWVSGEHSKLLVSKKCDPTKIRAVITSYLIDLYPEMDELRIKNIVHKATSHVVTASHINDFISDPRNIPEDLDRDYKAIYSSGELDDKAYAKLLKGTFAIMEEYQLEGGKTVVTKTENLATLKKRLGEFFAMANDQVHKEFNDAGLGELKLHPTVEGANDYAELIRISMESNDPKIAWDARVKIGTAFSIYQTAYSRTFQFREYDAKQIEIRMTTPNDGIKFKKGDLQEVLFIENGGNPQQVGESYVGDERVKKMNLLNTTINGVQCYLMPTTEGSKTDFIGVKSMSSCVGKQVRNGVTPETTTDMQRATIAYENEDQKEAIVDYLRTHYFGMFRKIEFKVYGKGKHSENTAAEYEAEKYSLKVLISYGNPLDHLHSAYFVTVEIRFLDIKNAIRERSDTHKASHKVFEKKRSRAVVEKYRPRSLFPELYEKNEPNENDIVGQQLNAEGHPTYSLRKKLS